MARGDIIRNGQNEAKDCEMPAFKPEEPREALKPHGFQVRRNQNEICYENWHEHFTHPAAEPDPTPVHFLQTEGDDAELRRAEKDTTGDQCPCAAASTGHRRHPAHQWHKFHHGTTRTTAGRFSTGWHEPASPEAR